MYIPVGVELSHACGVQYLLTHLCMVSHASVILSTLSLIVSKSPINVNEFGPTLLWDICTYIYIYMTFKKYGVLLQERNKM